MNEFIILSMVLRLVGFLRRGEASSMAAASGFTSLSPWTSVLYSGLLIAALWTSLEFQSFTELALFMKKVAPAF